jgi:hypothetical protein
MVWLVTLANSMSPHLSIDFVCFLVNWKKTSLMTINKVRHSPFSYRIFATQMKAAVPVYFSQRHPSSKQKNKDKEST